MSIDFTKVNEITTPSGSLSKIIRTSDNVQLWPISKFSIIDSDGKINSSFVKVKYYASKGDYTTLETDIGNIQEEVVVDNLKYAGVYRYVYEGSKLIDGADKFIMLQLTDDIKAQLKLYNKFHTDVYILFYTTPQYTANFTIGACLTNAIVDVPIKFSSAWNYTTTSISDTSPHTQSFGVDFKYQDTTTSGDSVASLCIPICDPGYITGAAPDSLEMTVLFRNMYFSKE